MTFEEWLSSQDYEEWRAGMAEDDILYPTDEDEELAYATRFEDHVAVRSVN